VAGPKAPATGRDVQRAEQHARSLVTNRRQAAANVDDARAKSSSCGAMAQVALYLWPPAKTGRLHGRSSSSRTDLELVVSTATRITDHSDHSRRRT
jgi:hypothetical protein